MAVVASILLVIAFIVALLATFMVPSKYNLVAMALAFYFASLLIGLVHFH